MCQKIFNSVFDKYPSIVFVAFCNPLVISVSKQILLWMSSTKKKKETQLKT